MNNNDVTFNQSFDRLIPIASGSVFNKISDQAEGSNPVNDYFQLLNGGNFLLLNGSPMTLLENA